MVNKIENNDLSVAGKEAFAVVDFSATWCGPCKMLAPVIEELSEELGDVTFFNVDVDDNRALAQEFKVASVPTVVFLKNGEEVGKSIGFIPKAQMKEVIETYKG